MSTLAARVEQHLIPFAQEIKQLSTIPGVKRLAATVILSEVGTDMSCFPDTAHLASWAGMAPGNHESAGKRRRAKARQRQSLAAHHRGPVRSRCREYPQRRAGRHLPPHDNPRRPQACCLRGRGPLAGRSRRGRFSARTS